MDEKRPSEKPKPHRQTQYADAELVRKAFARAKRLLALAPSPEELRDLPSPSKRIH
jgi:hypothetical protein